MRARWPGRPLKRRRLTGALIWMDEVRARLHPCADPPSILAPAAASSAKLSMSISLLCDNEMIVTPNVWFWLDGRYEWRHRGMPPPSWRDGLPGPKWLIETIICSMKLRSSSAEAAFGCCDERNGIGRWAQFDGSTLSRHGRHRPATPAFVLDRWSGNSRSLSTSRTEIGLCRMPGLVFGEGRLLADRCQCRTAGVLGSDFSGSDRAPRLRTSLAQRSAQPGNRGSRNADVVEGVGVNVPAMAAEGVTRSRNTLHRSLARRSCSGQTKTA